MVKYSETYRERIKEWNNLFRSTTRTEDITSFDPDLDYFSRDLSPILDHPLISKMPDRVKRGIQVHHLYYTLTYFLWAERGILTEACNQINQPDFLPDLPGWLKAGAHGVCQQEVIHSTWISNMEAAVHSATGIAPLDITPAFIFKLDELCDKASPELSTLINVFFTVITECYRSGLPDRIASDKHVQRQIRDLFSKHENEEILHRLYWATLSTNIWERLEIDLRGDLGAKFPEMLLCHFEFDRQAFTQILSAFSSDIADYEQVIDDVAAKSTLNHRIDQIRVEIIAVLRSIGVLGDKDVTEAFAKSGFMLT